jgi:N-acetylmuramoyl-L-alanine amidase
MINYISATNNNKFSSPRADIEAINTIVITYTVSDGDVHKAVTTMFDRGTSVHYTIKTDGFQDQHHNEDKQTFFAGKSSWHGVPSVNQYGIGIMLVNDAISEFPEAQINKTIALINDINSRHNTTMEVVGLGEVAPDRHVAPGKLFPWAKLAEAGIGKIKTVPDDISHTCTINPGDNSEEVSRIQENLKSHGYGIVITGEYDDLTSKVVSVFRGRYTQDEANLNCWNDAADYVLNDLLGVVSEAEISPMLVE